MRGTLKERLSPRPSSSPPRPSTLEPEGMERSAEAVPLDHGDPVQQGKGEEEHRQQVDPPVGINA